MSKSPPKLATNEVLGKLLQLSVANLLSRSNLVKGLNLIDPEGRNIDKECGYVEGEPSIALYKQLYDRVGIANRAITVYPEEAWSVYPELYEVEDERKTALERRWKEFEFKHSPWSMLHRVDEASRVARYGALFIGMNDGSNPKFPYPGIDRTGKKVEIKRNFQPEVLFLRPFSEDLIQIKEFERDFTNPRYGQPVMYNFKLSDPATDSTYTTTEQVTDLDVHWTRVVHITPNRKTSDIFGNPTLRPILNDISDLRKVAGGSAEMFWLGGFPGMAYQQIPGLNVNPVELDKKALEEEIEAYANGLQRFVRLIGMEAKSLAPNISDPSNMLIGIIQRICAVLGVPVPIFMGQEAGHLASSQNTVAWNRRLGKYQRDYLTPMVIKPFVQRLMLLDVLPYAETFIVSWRDLNALADTDKAKIALQKSQAILQYVTSGSYVLMGPKQYLTKVLWFGDDEADAVIAAAGGEKAMIAALKEKSQAALKQSPANSKTNPEKGTGAGGKRNGLGKKTKDKPKGSQP